MSRNITSLWWPNPPRIDLLWNVTTDCLLFGDFAHSIVRTSPDLDFCAVNINALVSLAKSSVLASHPRLREYNIGTPLQIASWYLAGCGLNASDPTCDTTCLSALNFRDQVRAELDKSTNMTCIGELRSSLGIKGNADIAGVGVSWENNP